MEQLHLEIDRFLRSGQGDFDALALRLFAYQYAGVLPYRVYCQARHIYPLDVKHWQDVPPVPTRAFQSTVLSTVPPEQAAAVFRSSSTTTGRSSRHYLKTLSFYETSLKTNFERAVLSGPSGAAGSQAMTMYILTPSPGEMPQSSLIWMFEVIKNTWGTRGSGYVVRNGRLDELWLMTLLAKSEAAKEPVLLMGTTIAFLAFFEHAVKAGRRFRLAAGSRILDTGGMKTEQREYSRREFVDQAGRVFGISEDDCVNEYGMCEMSSQCYGRGVSSYFEGPPWTRTLVIDPATGLPAPAGKAGLLRHFDLANVDSVLAIQTDDVGIAEGNGFVLQGRDPSADVKGCSLAAQSYLP